MLLRVEKLEKSFVTKKIFENVSFIVRKGDKTGIVGVNGVGKTTLLNIIAGEDRDFGGRYMYADESISSFYGKQYPKLGEGRSILELVAEGGPEEARARFIMKKLGFAEQDLDKKPRQLSGGMLTKVTLARAMYIEPELLILDEPNNHLDMEQLEYLEAFLRDYRGTAIIVSHDRKLLDNVCTGVVELSREGCKTYKGNYTAYMKQKEIELREQWAKYESYKKEKEKLKRLVSMQKDWYKRAHDAAGQNDFLRAKAKKHAAVMRAKRNALERLEENKVMKPRDIDRVNMKFMQAASEANVLIRAEGLSKSYGAQLIFEKSDFIIKNGERYGIMGPNGSGKTTLLNILCGADSDYKGSIGISSGIKVAYYRQLHENLKLDNTILEEIKEMGVSTEEARLLLGCYLLRGDDVFKRVEELSIGERSKVSVLKIMLSEADILVLDEPTNHMDIYTKERIEEALIDFNGTVIFVSHDRYFAEKMATRILAVEGKRIVEYPGGYEYYREKTAAEASAEGGRDSAVPRYDKIVLENKLSWLSGRLSEPTIDADSKQQLEKEYFEIYRQIKSM